jgi:hypothetical protein
MRAAVRGDRERARQRRIAEQSPGSAPAPRRTLRLPDTPPAEPEAEVKAVLPEAAPPIPPPTERTERRWLRLRRLTRT